MQLSLTQDELNHIVRKAIERNNGAEHDVMRDTLVEYLISLFPDKDFTLDEAATVEKLLIYSSNFQSLPLQELQ